VYCFGFIMKHCWSPFSLNLVTTGPVKAKNRYSSSNIVKKERIVGLGFLLGTNRLSGWEWSWSVEFSFCFGFVH
jgi:hypothetical protein